MFILKGVEETAQQTITLVKGISKLMLEYKIQVRNILKKAYSHELLNNLFSHPYTKIEFVMADVGVTRITAASYLNKLVSKGLLSKIKQGRYNYYLNMPLITLLMNNNEDLRSKHIEQIESVNE
ncbi:MAG: DNA-binding protein [Massilibacteroides sp.]|nr:DNA-binding protein [Massilibacteroides sp.]MDD4659418.1 DNA-binding protein [Massilibacteroides sp.]